MSGLEGSEQFISKALGHFRDAGLMIGSDAPTDDRASTASLKAALEFYNWDTLRENDFNPYRAGQIITKLAEDIKGA